MMSATSMKAAPSKPRVVMAALPNLRPLVTKGDSGSKGMVFLLAVMLISLTRASATLPVNPIERRSRSTM